jgi:ATP-dependent Lhr-like helicase
MTLSISGSDAAQAYDRLHPLVRRWVRDQGWASLRPVQVRAVQAILGGIRDVLISASTASGKTEAAFLPILTAIADRSRPGLSALYVSPLKALINDQFVRLEQLCETMEIPVVRWHGDASQATKARFVKNARGIALITPESIEAMFVRHPERIQRLMSGLDFMVIDEVHAFMQGPRGLHLAALMKRLAATTVGRTRRVGLSATIGDLDRAAAWLRPDDPGEVEIIDEPGLHLELMLQVRGYIEPGQPREIRRAAPLPDAEEPGEEDKVQDKDEVEGEDEDGDQVSDAGSTAAIHAISAHLFDTLRGENNLIFGRSRKTVETVADALRRKSEQRRVPNEFFPHHGSLSKDLREDLERRLKESDRPTSAVCTTTLELGIDIGKVKSVAQIGAPRSISSLRQRLGRTGRREGEASVLRIYVVEPELDQRSSLVDDLRPEMIRAVAAIRLLAQKFYEPASASDALATALLHQTLSLIAERGGVRADAAFDLLSGPGPFADVRPADYVELLRHAKAEGILEQAPDGVLMLGPVGERLVQARDFYPLFAVEEEWRLVLGAKTLGSIPLSNVIAIDSLVVFAGRRWKIVAVDEKARVIQVEAHKGGQVPRFDNHGNEEIHTRLIAEMKAVYESDEMPDYLDDVAKGLLAEGRAAYRRANLSHRSILEMGRNVLLFPWVGSAPLGAMCVALAGVGVRAEDNGVGITVSGSTASTVEGLKKLAAFTAEDFAAVENGALGLGGAKYDDFVPEPLLRRLWGRRNADVIAGLTEIARSLLLSA